jgi:hypothetical protein
MAGHNILQQLAAEAAFFLRGEVRSRSDKLKDLTGCRISNEFCNVATMEASTQNRVQRY